MLPDAAAEAIVRESLLQDFLTHQWIINHDGDGSLGFLHPDLPVEVLFDNTAQGVIDAYYELRLGDPRE